MNYIDPRTGARVATSTFGEWPEGSGVKAKRVASVQEIEEAEICYWKHEGDVWFIHFPECGYGNLRNHKIEEHEDGSITVSPSIRMMGHKDGKPMERHGFLVRGRWHEV